MNKTVARTTIIISLVTALAVSAFSFWVAPHFGKPAPADNPPATTQTTTPASEESKPDDTQPVHRTTVHRSTSSGYASAQPVHHHRSKTNSALIVAGSAGTGAAIGALAGGGKGAAIGALAGGAAGLVYDRVTANK